MRDEDLDRIEAALGLTLPAAYRATMRDYPFPPDSSAAEHWLLNEPERVIQNNRDWRASGLYDRPWPASFLALGGDGGEESYFLNVSEAPEPVMVADVEEGTLRVLTPDWASWLAMLDQWHAEIVEDERRKVERRRNKKWWQVWIR